MDGTGIRESMSWLIHKWKKKLAKAILSWSVGQCCDGSHKQECRKPWGMVLYPLRQLKWSFQNAVCTLLLALLKIISVPRLGMSGCSDPTLGSSPPSALSALRRVLASDQHPGLCFLCGRNDAFALRPAMGKTHVPIVISNGNFTVVCFPLSLYQVLYKSPLKTPDQFQELKCKARQ